MYGAGFLVDLEELDVSPVGREKRPNRIEGTPHAGRDVVGVQAVNDEEAGNEFVVGEGGRITLKAEPGPDAKGCAERDRKRMRKALAELRGTLDLGMTTDEFMRLVRGELR